jgi:hypothetical protein
MLASFPLHVELSLQESMGCFQGPGWKRELGAGRRQLRDMGLGLEVPRVSEVGTEHCETHL